MAEGATLGLAEPFTDIPSLEAKAQEFDARADEYARKAAAIRQIIAGVHALNGDADAVLMRRSFQAHGSAFEIGAPDENGPRGRRAVLTVMATKPGRVWKVVDLKRELLRRGWAPTPKAVEASVANLRRRGEVEAVGYGHYKLTPDGRKEVRSEAASG